MHPPDDGTEYFHTDPERPIGAQELTLVRRWLADTSAHVRGQQLRRQGGKDIPDLQQRYDSAEAPIAEQLPATLLRLCQRLAGQLTRQLAPEPAVPVLNSQVQQFWLAQLLGLPDPQTLALRVLEYKAQSHFFPPGQLEARGLDQAGLMLRQLEACQEIALRFEHTLGAPDQLSLTLGGLYVQLVLLTGEYEKRGTPLDEGLPKSSSTSADLLAQTQADPALAFTYPPPEPPSPDA